MKSNTFFQRTSRILLFGYLLVLVGCFGARHGAGKDDGQIELVFLQMNDVYEIAPLADGTGGLARVAHLRNELLKKNPNTFTVLSGDFISPSVVGALKHEGKRIRGKQMIESLNALGLDWVVFGNHEFDYDLDDLQARLDESDFVWMAANARLVGEGVPPQPFFKNRSKGIEPCPDNLSCIVRDADGTEIRLGVFGVLVDSGKKSFVSYSDFMDVAKEEYNELKSRTDLVVALTHLDIDDDLKLSASLPNVPLLMGGHDHDNMLHRVGANTVAKADANARTVYVHTVQFNKRTGKSVVKSELIKVDSSIPDDPKTAAVVSKWEQIKKSALKDSGFDADMPVIQLEKPLDCRDAYTRHQQMPVGEMITSAMMAASKNKPECAILNSGSIRVDDVLTGTLTELDIVRMLPFGGGIVEVDMTGVALQKVLNIGTETNKGKGGYLQIRGVKPAPNSSGWLVGKMELNTEKTYRVVLPSFLLTGNETNLGFLKTNTNDGGKTTDNPDIPRMFLADKNNPKDLRVDIRRALIAFLRGE